MRLRMAVYVGESWFEEFMNECGQPFLTYWQATDEVTREEAPPVTSFAARLLAPVSFSVPDVPHPLRFFMNEEELGE